MDVIGFTRKTIIDHHRLAKSKLKKREGQRKREREREKKNIQSGEVILRRPSARVYSCHSNMSVYVSWAVNISRPVNTAH